MRYTSFRIKNFKGIKDTTVNLSGIAGASVFAFVGLNESGKTTILEAIHSFSPDQATSELVGGDEASGVAYLERVPRHQISSFTGDVSVAASVHIDDAEINDLIKDVEEEYKILIDKSSFPNEVVFERYQRFKDGDFVASYFALRTDLKVKSLKQKKWREPTKDEKTNIRDALYNSTPDISYFPTFVFDFPERIYLTERGTKLDRFYKTVFQDILDLDGKGYKIEKDIIRRVRSDNLVVPWFKFLELWSQHNDVSKIQHVMDRASATVTRYVFGRWNKIFGEDTKGKEIVIASDISEGEVKSLSGGYTKTEKHDVSIKFQIRDGTRRFDVNDRSLGFRWFFAFMLFTQFRVARTSSRPVLFLFDEPASNLHAAAQQKLIDCFPEIAKGEHALIYTTHSHYMIEPKWLEQTYIVTNRADTPTESVLDAVSLDDESLDIQIQSYRSFVDKHSNQTSYFQPILDRLEVVPSRFDMRANAIVVEGRSDYYILRYCAVLHDKLQLALMPGLGASTFGALAALSIGWNLNFIFILDGDLQGKADKEKYVYDYGVARSKIFTLDEIVSSNKVIEDLIDTEALAIIQQEIKSAKTPNKAQIKRFFQERLASGNVTSLGKKFDAKSLAVLQKIESVQGATQ